MKYKFIQPTIRVKDFVQAVFAPFDSRQLQSLLETQFPETSIQITDSGRSALAAIIENLDLTGKTLALPAYICDVLFPVLQKYNIKPIFLDIDPETFMPSLEEYEKKITSSVNAILVCPTYGKNMAPDILNYLQKSQKTLIEDRSHCPDFIKREDKSQFLPSQAFYTSFPKIFPVPEGGLAVIQGKKTPNTDLHPSSTRFGFFKRMIQLFRMGRKWILFFKQIFQLDNIGNPQFSTIFLPKRISQKLIYFFLKRQPYNQTSDSFCLPFLTDNKNSVMNHLSSLGIQAETIWQEPIILNSEVQKSYQIKKEEYPNTLLVASQILCLPPLSREELEHLPQEIRTQLR